MLMLNNYRINFITSCMLDYVESTAVYEQTALHQRLAQIYYYDNIILLNPDYLDRAINIITVLEFGQLGKIQLVDINNAVYDYRNM